MSEHRMTGLDFLREGVEFTTDAQGWVCAKGPPDRDDLREQLTFEVAMRVELVGDDPALRRREPRRNRCDHCGDPLHGSLTGGTCYLCALARKRALRAKGSRA